MLLRKIDVEMEILETGELRNIGASVLSLLISFSDDRAAIAKCISLEGTKLLIKTSDGVVTSRVILANGERIRVSFSWICDFSINLRTGMMVKLNNIDAKIISVKVEEREISEKKSSVIIVDTVSPIAIFNQIPEPLELLNKYVKLGIISEDDLNKSWISEHRIRGKYNGRFYEINGFMKINIPSGISNELIEALGLGRITCVGYGTVKTLSK